MTATPLLDVSGLTISFPAEGRRFTVVRALDLAVAAGETVAVVGESGSGKSVSSLAITRLLDYGPGRIDSGSIRFQTRGGQWLDLAQENADSMRRLRGPELAMIFQEPMSSLNPVLRVGEQIAESLMLHQGLDHAAALAEARAMLERVRIPDAARQLRRYPFQLSGGMRQRVMIAIALACRPRLLIADEPTTALDVTVQAQVLRLLRSLQAEFGMGLMFITHDMGVVAEIADRVVVMRRGEKVEEGETGRDLRRAAAIPTRARCSPRCPVLGSLSGQTLPAPFPDAGAAWRRAAGYRATPAARRCSACADLTTRFDIRRGLFGRLAGRIHAVEQVSFEIRPARRSAWSAKRLRQVDHRRAASSGSRSRRPGRSCSTARI